MRDFVEPLFAGEVLDRAGRVRCIVRRDLEGDVEQAASVSMQGRGSPRCQAETLSLPIPVEREPACRLAVYDFGGPNFGLDEALYRRLFGGDMAPQTPPERSQGAAQPRLNVGLHRAGVQNAGRIL